jgi:hypothetical protein
MLSTWPPGQCATVRCAKRLGRVKDQLKPIWAQGSSEARQRARHRHGTAVLRRVMRDTCPPDDSRQPKENGLRRQVGAPTGRSVQADPDGVATNPKSLRPLRRTGRWGPACGPNHCQKVSRISAFTSSGLCAFGSPITMVSASASYSSVFVSKLIPAGSARKRICDTASTRSRCVTVCSNRDCFAARASAWRRCHTTRLSRRDHFMKQSSQERAPRRSEEQSLRSEDPCVARPSWGRKGSRRDPGSRPSAVSRQNRGSRAGSAIHSLPADSARAGGRSSVRIGPPCRF